MNRRITSFALISAFFSSLLMASTVLGDDGYWSHRRYGEPGTSSYGGVGTPAPSPKSKGDDTSVPFSGGGTYIRANCLSQWKDWAGSCCYQYDSKDECEKKTHKTCIPADPKELDRRYREVRKRSTAQPACSDY